MADSSHDAPPGLPTVHDEAGKTPLWLPIVGIVLLVLSLVAAVWRGAHEEHRGGGTELRLAPAPAPAAPAAE